MSVFGAGFVVIAFATLVYFIGLVFRGREVITVARNAFGVMQDRALSDLEKEKALQRYAIRLFALLGILLVGIAVALIVPLGIVWMIDKVGYPLLDPTLVMLQRWDFLIAVSVIGGILYYGVRRFRL